LQRPRRDRPWLSRPVFFCGRAPSRDSFLEHHRSLIVPAGSRLKLRVEGFRTGSADGDLFAFEYSDADIDLEAPLPATLSANVLIRVVGTNRGDPERHSRIREVRFPPAPGVSMGAPEGGRTRSGVEAA
jgi:hypothetical protein